MSEAAMSGNGAPRPDASEASRPRADGLLYNAEEMAEVERLERLVANVTMLSRSALFRGLSDPRRDINASCGFPPYGPVDAWAFWDLWERNPIAARVVEVLPKETWGVTPSVYETEDENDVTPFERAWDDLSKNLMASGQSFYDDKDCLPVWEALRRVDVLSGIGSYGVILLGLDDGGDLSLPPKGFTEIGSVEAEVKQGDDGRGGEKDRQNGGSQLGEKQRGAGVQRSQGGKDVWGRQSWNVARSDEASWNAAASDEREELPRRFPRYRLITNASEASRRGRDADSPDQFLKKSGPLGMASSNDGDGEERSSQSDQETGDDPVDSAGARRKLLYLRVFPETLAQITAFESNPTSPRFGMPTRYLLTYNDPRTARGGIGLPLASVQVHWSRVVHVADLHHQATSSEVFAAPRMLCVLNNLLGLEKLYGGGPEMLWQGAFPGLQFSTHPQLGGQVKVNIQEIKDAVEQYKNSLDRVLLGRGGTWSTLSPNVADVTAGVDLQIKAICVKIGCPVPVFQGYEIGEQASENNDTNWAKQLKGRQSGYATPRVIVPFVDRLVQLGVLPKPKRRPVDSGAKTGAGMPGAQQPGAGPLDGTDKGSGLGPDDQGEDAAAAVGPDGSPPISFGGKKKRPSPSVLGNALPFKPKGDDTSGKTRPPFPLRGGPPAGDSQGKNGTDASLPPWMQGKGNQPDGAAPGDPSTKLGPDGKPIKVETKLGYYVEWPDVVKANPKDKATVNLTNTQAVAAYVAGNVESIVPPLEWLTNEHFMGLDPDDAAAMLEEGQRIEAENDLKQQALGDRHGFEPTPPDGMVDPEQQDREHEVALAAAKNPAGAAPPPFGDKDGPPFSGGGAGFPKSRGPKPPRPSGPFARNVFCPTGAGGGVDPSCSPGGASASATPEGVFGGAKSKDKIVPIAAAMTTGTYAQPFKAGGRSFRFTAVPPDAYSPSGWAVVFFDTGAKTTKMTGLAGARAVPIMRAAGRELDKFVESKRPERFWYTAKGSETSRVSLYDRVSSAIAARHGYSLEREDRVDHVVYRFKKLPGKGVANTAGLSFDGWWDLLGDDFCPVSNDASSSLVGSASQATSNEFDPDQPRADDGKWTDGGSAGSGVHHAEMPSGDRVKVRVNPTAEHLSEMLASVPKVGAPIKGLVSGGKAYVFDARIPGEEPSPHWGHAEFSHGQVAAALGHEVAKGYSFKDSFRVGEEGGKPVVYPYVDGSGPVKAFADKVAAAAAVSTPVPSASVGQAARDASGGIGRYAKLGPGGQRWTAAGPGTTREGVPLGEAKAISREDAREAIRWHGGMSSIAGSNGPNSSLPEASRPHLSETQRGALQKYSFGNSGPLNAMLMREPGWHRFEGSPYGPRFFDELHGQLRSAFAAAPTFSRPVPVVAGIRLPPPEAAAMAERFSGAKGSGEPVELPGYTQAFRPGGLMHALGMSSGVPADQRGNVTLHVEAVHGLDMRPFSQFSAERGLLLPAGSRYDVSSVARRSDGWHVGLRQRPPKTENAKMMKDDEATREITPAQQVEEARDDDAMRRCLAEHPERIDATVERSSRSVRFRGERKGE